jgi:hypothetical protein
MNRAVALLALTLIASTARAQGSKPTMLDLALARVPVPSRVRVATAADSLPATIAEAEAQGRRYPRSVRPGSFPRSIDSVGYVGTPERSCVDANGAQVARSGEFGAGNFAMYGPRRVAGPIKLWWFPLHAAQPGAPTTLVVRTMRIDGPADGHVYTGRPITSLVPLRESPMIPSGPVIGATGRWMLIATAAENWGCFLLKIA